MFEKDKITKLEFKIRILEDRLHAIENMAVSRDSGVIVPANNFFYKWDPLYFSVPTVILIKLLFDHLGLTVKHNPYGQWSLEKKDR